VGAQRINRVEDMPVYQLFMQLALDVEKATRDYRRDFSWLRTQSLKSSESVPANMTEGFYSQYSTEYLQCLYRCRREARETTTHIDYGRNAGVLAAVTAKNLLERYEDGCRQLTSVIASVERKIAAKGKGKPGFGTVKEEREAWLVLDDDETAGSVLSSTINHQPSTMAR